MSNFMRNLEICEQCEVYLGYVNNRTEDEKVTLDEEGIHLWLERSNITIECLMCVYEVEQLFASGCEL